MSVHFSSKTCEWETPQALFDELSAEFGPFDLDVCANPVNAKCSNWLDREENGLGYEWAPHRCWMNPPYGREIGKWVKKAALSNTRVVCLLPARTDTAWWHDWVLPRAKVIRFLRGRVKFGGAKNGAPFPSAVVVFGS